MENTVVKEKTDFAKRYNLFPIKDPEAYEFYVRLESSHWVPYELSYHIDKNDYKRLSEYDSTGNNEKMKRLIDLFLGFVLPSDGLICENIVDNFYRKAETFEETLFFACQIHNETIHSITYGLVAEALISSENEKKRIAEMVDNLPCLQAKVALMEKYRLGDYNKAERYAAFAAAEGILFTVLFNIIFWFKSKNMFKNLIDANRMINRDEAAHRNFGCDRYKRIPDRDGKRTLEIVKEFVEVEKDFIEVMVPEPIEDLTQESLVSYLYTIADNLLIELGEPRYYNSDYCPAWLDMGNEQKANFFEVTSTEYNRFNVEEALNTDKLTGNVQKIDAIDNAEEIEF